VEKGGPNYGLLLKTAQSEQYWPNVLAKIRPIWSPWKQRSRLGRWDGINVFYDLSTDMYIHCWWPCTYIQYLPSIPGKAIYLLAIYSSPSLHVPKYVDTCMYIHMYIYACTYICTYMHVHTYVHICM
jgi:hypothetical protein